MCMCLQVYTLHRHKHRVAKDANAAHLTQPSNEKVDPMDVLWLIYKWQKGLHECHNKDGGVKKCYVELMTPPRAG